MKKLVLLLSITFVGSFAIGIMPSFVGYNFVEAETNETAVTIPQWMWDEWWNNYLNPTTTTQYHSSDDDTIEKSESGKKSEIVGNPKNFYPSDIKNDIQTRKYRVYGCIEYNGNYYYKDDDGSLHKGWKEENGHWYYFDPKTYALVMDELRDIDGVVYYLQSNGQMAHDTTVTIAGVKIKIDSSGACTPIG